MNKINEKNELIDFEPQMLETVTLDCENDFGGFLQIVSETDSEMKNILSPVIEEGLKELVKLMPFPLTIVYDRYYVDSIYRDEYYNEDSEKKGIAEIIVDKQRNGSTGSVELVWLGQYTKFGNKERAPH